MKEQHKIKKKKGKKGKNATGKVASLKHHNIEKVKLKQSDPVASKTALWCQILLYKPHVSFDILPIVDHIIIMASTETNRLSPL